MQLTANTWLGGPYYMEVDELGQLRIAGPNNHLHFGMVGIQLPAYEIRQTRLVRGQLEVELALDSRVKRLVDPVMGHMRGVRQFIELGGEQRPTFAEVRAEDVAALRPHQVTARSGNDGLRVRYLRRYQQYRYGVEVRFPAGSHYDAAAHEVRLPSSSTAQSVVIRTLCSDPPLPALKQAAAAWRPQAETDQALVLLADRSAIEAEHLINYGKTSGFEYGTVFPRDWMETADLGVGDLTSEARRYMYHRALEFVSEEGEGWHENLVGEYLYEQQQHEAARTSLAELVGRSTDRVLGQLADGLELAQPEAVTRQMIDIEPHYILGLQQFDWSDLVEADRAQLARVAAQIVQTTTDQPLVTFKKIPPARRRPGEAYYGHGNWRDSRRAFKLIHPVIAPYDVNVVFYPQALRLIAVHAEQLGVDPRQVELLISKWDRVRDWYRFKNPDDHTTAYALALYDVRVEDQEFSYRRLEVNHLDESYELFYGNPSENDAVSFARRVLDPRYFYTPSGPLLVGSDDGYSTLDYHGRVSWAKQTAYTVAGLRRVCEQQQGHWDSQSLRLLRQAGLETAENSLKAFLSLGGVPELHYDQGGRAHFYNDQPEAEGPMNRVQLWSAVGARRIMRDYLALRQFK